MPAWAECDGQGSDITVWADPRTLHSEIGLGGTWGTFPVALVTGVKGLGSRQSSDAQLMHATSQALLL